MKAVTEFPGFTLKKALQEKATLATEGKTPEEIQAAMATSYKLEGEKLTCFMNSLEIASQNLENLKRVVVMRLNEGENAPAKSVKVEELYYVAESTVLVREPKPEKPGRGGRHGGKGGGGRGGRGKPT